MRLTLHCTCGSSTVYEQKTGDRKKNIDKIDERFVEFAMKHRDEEVTSKTVRNAISGESTTVRTFTRHIIKDINGKPIIGGRWKADPSPKDRVR